MADTKATQWVKRGNRLQKTFAFAGFADAMGFMLRASYECEKLDHHPEWKNIYNKVWVRLCTHKAGDKVTAKDRALAKTLDKIFNTFVT